VIEASLSDPAGSIAAPATLCLLRSNLSRRRVPIPTILRAYLAEHRLAQGSPEGSALAFGRTATRPFEPRNLTRRADVAWRKAGLTRITPHECRHTFASLMIAAGVNVKALSTFAGHSSVAITLDLYGHLMPGAEDEAAELLDTYLSLAGATTGAISGK
jgi:integrase